jgi:predicted TIM-barrel fold metal-dependent hydrolase
VTTNATGLADLPVIDGHIHLNHLAQLNDVAALIDAAPLLRANLVCTPNPEPINHNPALIVFKDRYPDRAYISGALDYSEALAQPTRMPEVLASQVYALHAIGFDGLKMTEGKPTKRKWLPFPLDAPLYNGVWTALERLGMPVLLHVGDPEAYWDLRRCPERARARGWFYGDDTFPSKESLHAEIVHVLERHPDLKAILAHFHFLSADLERAGRLLDAYPNVCLDLAPGSEMYNSFTRRPDQSRSFFLRYQERLIYGTDTTTGGMARDGDRGVERALERAWVVRTFLETSEAFAPPQALRRWLEGGLDRFRGLGLPRQALAWIYRTNIERVYGPTPAPLDRERALALVRRMAAVLDRRSGSQEGNNHARQALEMLAKQKRCLRGVPV